MICVSVHYHWVKMTSGVFMLAVIGHLSKQTMLIFLMSRSIMVTYLILHNMSHQTMFNEINEFEHHMNHIVNTCELTLTFM